MTEAWAEGSGSTLEDLWGDPRIEAEAIVLVGVRGGERLPDSCRALLGSRGVVVASTDPDHGEPRFVDVKIGKELIAYHARDCVCLRAAAGELTEEGRALEAWSGVDADGWLTRVPLTKWGERAGILLPRQPEGYAIDRRRLAMALGREAVAGVDWGTNPPTVAVVQRPAAPPPPPAPVMCSRCGVQPATSKVRGIATTFCSDCAQIVDDEFHRESVSHGDDDDAKYSGAQHLDALRAWLRRPMGTR